MSSPSITRIIDRQIRQWELHRQLQRLAEEGERRAPPLPTLTISREMASGGEELAELLARRLGFTVHDQDLIDRIARDKGIERRIVEQLDEQSRSEIELWVHGMLRQRLFTGDEFLVRLARAVRTLADRGGVIILGRGAHMLLAGRCCLRLRVVASLETRVDRLVQAEGLEPETARARLAESDRRREEFLRKFYGDDALDPRRFDLVLNSDQLPPPAMADAVLAALESSGLFEGCRTRETDRG